MDISKLDAAVRAVCPSLMGISIGDPADRSTWRLDIGPEATGAQRQAAQGALAAYIDAPAVAPVPGTAILDALSPEQAAKADVRDLIRIGTAADIATVKSKIKRVAAAAGTTPDALRAAAAAS